ncbi:MAG: hypothetical protein N2490_07940 [Ignavibacteria bacterium]|nr:hypothetical protein [Ignavibacteria bacterium]
MNITNFYYKKILFFIFIYLFLRGLAYGHFEPPKTLKEKEKMEEERKFIFNNKINSLSVWKFKIDDGIVKQENKILFYTIEYDRNGNVSIITVYNEDGSIKYKDIYLYDEFMNVISLTEYTEDKVSAKSEFKYDEYGRIKEQINYAIDGEFDSKFNYSIDYRNNTIIFNKYKQFDSIEYQIIYKYDSNPDYGNNIEIIKQKPNGKLIMRVENVFEDNNLRKEKRIFDETNKLLYYFTYKYFASGDKFSEIQKKTEEGNTISKTLYNLNINGLIENVITYDSNDKMDSYLEYSYQFY